MPQSPVTIIGGGLAGTECAFQLAQRGVPVVLYEMRPEQTTPAHQTGHLAEMVCSNSFRSDDPEHAAGLLKREMEAFSSLLLDAARACAVPAGSALAVDRTLFAQRVSNEVEEHPGIEVRRQEVRELPGGDVVLATGPLTSDALATELIQLLGGDALFFYDAIAPIVEADSLDMDKLFWGSRYDKGGGDDYLNAPMDERQYHAFHQALLEADALIPRDFEKNFFFEGCLPVEEIARRGFDTLRFGAMKPVGLRTPDGSRPCAVVQLRREDLAHSQFNLVGFQSRLRWPDQRRIFRMIPGLEQAQFVRLGQIHRNTFINAPQHLDRLYRIRQRPALRLAGQLTGVEGYLESGATGLLCALYLWLERNGREEMPLPATTALGALARHLTESSPKNFQPANINYGLFEPLQQRLPKRLRRGAYAARAAHDLRAWATQAGVEIAQATKTASVPATTSSR